MYIAHLHNPLISAPLSVLASVIVESDGMKARMNVVMMMVKIKSRSMALKSLWEDGQHTLPWRHGKQRMVTNTQGRAVMERMERRLCRAWTLRSRKSPVMDYALGKVTSTHVCHHLTECFISHEWLR